MRAVIDTNVLVSGLMTDGPPPSEVVTDVFARSVVLLYDLRILDEYRRVFARPRLRLSQERAGALLVHIEANGEVVPDAHFNRSLPDATDQKFADVAFTGQADLLITGNLRDFPVGDAIRIVTPREWVEIKRKAREQK